MKFQELVDSMAAMTCVMSVEKLDDGGYGEIRIVTGNKAYIDSIENPVGSITMLRDRFVPNTPYTDYLPRDLNFEEYCYRSAVEKKCLHSYAHPERFDVWFDMTFLPLYPDDGNICYCTYTMEITFERSSEKTSDVTEEVAKTVLDSTVKLRGARDFEKVMDEIIKDVRKMCDSDGCRILLLDDENRTCRVLCEDFDKDSALYPMEENMDDDFYDLAMTWEDAIAGSNCLIAKNKRDMQIVKERNPAWYESLRRASVNSIALFPLRPHDKTIGYIWAANFDEERYTRIKEVLELASFILGAEIDNRLMVDRLKVLSSRDMLTGLQNRNEMNNYVSRLTSDPSNESVGVIFADLNGLKTVNDEEGHAAGDRLLIDAANSLREIFYEKDIFRVGGDEFVVIEIGATQEELENKMKELRKASEKYRNLAFAIGCCADDSMANLENAFTLADERMYEDKAEYYRNNPHKNRRKG